MWKRSNLQGGVARNAVVELEPETVHRMLQDRSARLIDVREPDERRQEFIPGSLPMPLGALEEKTIAESGGRLTIFHCRSGKRSRRALDTVLAKGHQNVAHMKGGIEAWKAGGLPVAGEGSGALRLSR